MNRRNFIEKSSVMAIAIAGLPSALKKRQLNVPYRYKNELIEGKAEQTQFILTIYHSSIESFATAAAEEKFLGLTASYFATDDITTATKSGEFKYLIESVEPKDKSDNLWKVKTKFSDKISGDYEFPKAYPKDLRLQIKPSFFADLLTKKDKTLVSIPFSSVYTPESGGSGDCFLTTACVREMKLADDCNELQSLRFLRDDYMMTTIEGRSLAKQYRTVGPSIIKAIDNCENSADIYRYMYQHMIQPAVQLVNNREYETAVAYYAQFVQALEEKFCIGHS